MALHALPYQMETINELFSPLHAGDTEKGTGQGWANLKQCRRLDACLGQTRTSSFALTGKLGGRIERWHSDEWPSSSGELRGLHIYPHALPCPRTAEETPHGKAEHGALAPCSMGTQRHGEFPSPEQCLPGWEHDGLRHRHVLSQCRVTVPAPAKSRVSWPHPWAGGPVGERSSYPGQPRKGREYYTAERLLVTLTCSQTFQAVGERCSKASSLRMDLAHSCSIWRGKRTRSRPRPAKHAQIQARTSVPQHRSESGLVRSGVGYRRRGQATRFEG